MKQGIRDYLRKEHNMINQTPGMVDKPLVANFLGDWCQDIICNRGVANKEGKRNKD